MPSATPPHRLFDFIGKVSARIAASAAAPWLTVGSRSFPAVFYEIDGKNYVIDIFLKRRVSDYRRHSRGTLKADGTRTEVTFTEVTDPVLKHQVVIAYAAEKPKVLIATGEHKNRPPTSFLVNMGLAPDDTPEGLLAAVPHVDVFEVTPVT